eukprot:5010832-Prymnesium_polylepis.1
MSKPQLLKRKWSEDITRNVRARESLRKPWRKCAKGRERSAGRRCLFSKVCESEDCLAKLKLR